MKMTGDIAMKRAAKYVLITVAILIAMIVFLLCVFLYITEYKVKNVDASQSPDGTYELKFQEIGEPAFPFGSADGRLILSGPDGRISKVSVDIANDGGRIDAFDWSVAWYDDRAEVTLMGEEQADELVTLYFDGSYETQTLETHWGKLTQTDTQEDSETEAETAADTEPVEDFDGQWIMEDGYRAIYDTLADDVSGDNFDVHYGASQYSSWCIVSEGEDAVWYLVYDRQSVNGKCGLYVYYESKKDDDGEWDKDNAVILDIYAYEYDTGEVISSGKTGWGDAGSQEYQDAAGE